MRATFAILSLLMLAFAGCVSDDEPSDAGMDDEAEAPPSAVDQAAAGGYQGFDGEPADCQKIVPPGPISTDAGFLTGYETRVLDVVLVVDQSFVTVHGESWLDVVDFIATMADDVYQRELQLEVNVVDVIAIPADNLTVIENTGSEVAGEESQKILDDTQIFMDEHYADLDRDLVYTLVGTSAAGVIAGQADCIGGARYKDVAYGWGEALDIDQYVLDLGPGGLGEYTSVKVILHEMAHILGAHHHYQWCGVPLAQSAPSDLLGACSIMTNAVDFASFYFSPINKAAIRGYADEVDL